MKKIDLEVLRIDPKREKILISRYNDAQKCISVSPLASLLLSGSFLEGLLLAVAEKKTKRI